MKVPFEARGVQTRDSSSCATRHSAGCMMSEGRRLFATLLDLSGPAAEAAEFEVRCRGRNDTRRAFPLRRELGDRRPPGAGRTHGHHQGPGPRSPEGGGLLRGESSHQPILSGRGVAIEGSGRRRATVGVSELEARGPFTPRERRDLRRRPPPAHSPPANIPSHSTAATDSCGPRPDPLNAVVSRASQGPSS